jgi:DNA modification methylase
MQKIEINKINLFGNFDFQNLAYDTDFKEDSVREVVVLPILNALGYTQDNIVRSKSLQHPFLKIGSKKRPINLVPDYVLKVENNFAWVLDAKAPNQKIKNDDNVEQVYSYATHPEIRSTYFALCNGLEFSLFRTGDTGKPILFFLINEIEQYWSDLKLYLSPDSFQVGKNFTYDTTTATAKPKGQFDYSNRPLLEEITELKRQSAKRHKGVHGYFTRQVWKVVSEYIRNFSKPGDLVLDPFGGSGVTAIEALMNNRRAISIDINPMPVFIVQSLIAPVNLNEFTIAFERVKAKYLKFEPKSILEIDAILKKFPFPKGIRLPRGSDVETIEQLFSDEQLAKLAMLKSIIKEEKDKNIKDNLLLVFSASLYKINRTYQAPKNVSDGGGNSGVFAYYRYRVAPNPANENLISVFESRFRKVKDAKKEMAYFIDEQTISNTQIIKGTATNLKFIPKESVDYIYTDPPYGKKIPYLDLSVMWNAWLDLEVSQQDYDQEAIEGGESKKSKNQYNELIAQSIKEMYRVLKFDRWLSFVFAHKDPEFWHLIIDTAESCGFEYIGAVPQKNGQTSFKKKQNPFTVLSGQLIINFRKVRNPKAIMKANLGMDIAEIVLQTIEGIIAKNNGATLEQINDELIIKGLELGFLDLLKKEYSDLTPVLMGSFDYDENTGEFTIQKNSQFKSHLDVRLRIKYYLISYLRRMERENKSPHFDEIVLSILPLLKNGSTPKRQTILNVLEDIGEHLGQDSWRLKQEGQTTLFY